MMGSKDPDLRIGLGFDRHRLVAGRRCVLGGVTIPFEKGPLGHSDGDALLHAIIDAVLGAAGLDDLGTLFSDRDPRFKDAESSTFAKEAVARVRAAGFEILSIDSVVLAEAPRIGPHRVAIRARIAELFEIDSSQVNVKGKSGEGVGPIGTGEIVEVTAIALLRARRAIG